MRAICDRCGFEYQLSELRKEWTNLMVCNGPATNQCWEPRHPQDFVRAVRDNQGVRPDMRPEPADVFVSVAVQDDSFSILLGSGGEVVMDE